MIEKKDLTKETYIKFKSRIIYINPDVRKNLINKLKKNYISEVVIEDIKDFTSNELILFMFGFEIGASIENNAMKIKIKELINDALDTL